VYVLVQGETKKRNQHFDSCGLQITDEQLPVTIQVLISFLFSSLHKLLFMLKFYMDIDDCVIYPSIFLL
jgi:hypothetical protein